MNIDERTIETRFACRVEHQLVQYLAGIPGTTEKCIGANARCRQSAIEVEPAQNLRDVGAQDNAGADAREIRALFIDRDREAGALQQPGGRETGKARARIAIRVVLSMPSAPRRLNHLDASVGRLSSGKHARGQKASDNIPLQPFDVTCH